jgi:hypothetical protein
MKVDAGIMIHLRGRGQIQFINRDFPMMLVSYVERLARQNIVMNLFRRSSILEHKRHCIFVVDGGRNLLLSGGRLVRGIGRVRRRIRIQRSSVLGLRRVSFAAIVLERL